MEQGGFSYAHKFDYSHTLAQFSDHFADIACGEVYSDVTVKVCGRVQSIRAMGKKLVFIDVLQGETTVQVKMHNTEDYQGNFLHDAKLVKRGDVVVSWDTRPEPTLANCPSLLAQWTFSVPL